MFDSIFLLVLDIIAIGQLKQTTGTAAMPFSLQLNSSEKMFLIGVAKLSLVAWEQLIIVSGIDVYIK